MNIRNLIGSADKIWLLVMPFLVIGLILNIIFPSWFGVGGPAAALQAVSIILLIPGVVIWIWSVILILAKVPKGQLITGGPYALVKHPLYTGVGLLVFPWVGFLLNSWLGALLGIVLYIGTRIFAPEEEKKLAKAFGPAWEQYTKTVMLPWL